MGVGIAMGAAAIGMGVMGAISAGDAAAAENQARADQYAHQIGQETWQYGEAVWGVAQRNATRWMQNQANMEAAATNYGRNQVALAKTTEARRKQMSRAQKTINASVMSGLSSKMAVGSGTAERIKKQMELQGQENWGREFRTKLNSERQLKQQFENNLKGGSDLSHDHIGAYQPGLPPQMQNVGMATLNGGIQGAAQGIQMVGGIMGAMNSYQEWAGSGASGGDLGTLGNAAASDSTGDAYMAALGF